MFLAYMYFKIQSRTIKYNSALWITSRQTLNLQGWFQFSQNQKTKIGFVGLIQNVGTNLACARLAIAKIIVCQIRVCLKPLLPTTWS